MTSKRTINIIALIVGLGALSFLVYDVGWRSLVDNLIAFGPAFPLILVIEAASNGLSCFGWYYAFEGSERPGFFKLLKINFASLSVAGALPTGQAGEVAKGNLLRGLTPGVGILSSLFIYNYFHVLTTSLLVAIGPLVALITGEFEPRIAWITWGVGAATLLGVLVLGGLLYSGVLGRVLRGIGSARFIPFSPSDELMKSVDDVDHRLSGIVKHRPGDLLKGTAGLLGGRLLQALEIYTILAYMGVSQSFTVTLMVFSATSVANYLLMVLPAREGFLEGSSYLVFELLGLSGADGLAMELTRRLRKLAYQGIGILLMIGLVGGKSQGAEER